MEKVKIGVVHLTSPEDGTGYLSNGKNFNNYFGMIFVGSNKAVQDAAINRLLWLVGIAVLAVMALCIAAASRIAASISRNIQSSIGIVKTVAEGKLDVEIGKRCFPIKMRQESYQERCLRFVMR